MAGILHGARGLRVSEALWAPTGSAGGTVPANSPTLHRVLTGAVGRSHTTPTPHPDPRDSGRRTVGALRLSELAPCLTLMVSPGRAQGLHPAPRTHQPIGVRSRLANTLRLGPAYPYNIGPCGQPLN